MFNTFGSTSLGSHSNLPTPGELSRNGTPKQRTRILHEKDCQHGPVKILMKNGVRLPKPEIISVTERKTA